jgi:hypothetical protein
VGVTVADARLELDRHIANLRTLDSLHGTPEAIGMCLSLITDDISRLVESAKAEGAREECARMLALAEFAEKAPVQP